MNGFTTRQPSDPISGTGGPDMALVHAALRDPDTLAKVTKVTK